MPISQEGHEALRGETRLPFADEDAAREGVVQDLVNQPDRPLTDEEEEAAKRDPGRPDRVYAPDSARVPKAPAPGDDKLIQGSPDA